MARVHTLARRTDAPAMLVQLTDCHLFGEPDTVMLGVIADLTEGEPTDRAANDAIAAALIEQLGAEAVGTDEFTTDGGVDVVLYSFGMADEDGDFVGLLGLVQPEPDQLTAVLPCSRSDVYHTICCPHSILIMLHYNQSISQIPQMLQGSQKLIIVPLMKSDTWLVQNICNAYQSRTNLSCQTDTLGFAP